MTFTFILAVGIAIASGVLFVVSVLQAWNIYHNPNLKPHPVINLKEARNQQYGFKWMQIGPITSSIISPMRTEQGAIWSGLSFGISRENGKAATISITVYGAEQGVGHYTWRARTNKYRSEVGAGGHFNIDRIIGEKQSRRESRILGYAVDEASRGVNGHYHPLQFSVDEEKDTLIIYDPESGRMVFPNHDREEGGDSFIFGPPPMANSKVPYAQKPGAYISRYSSLREGVKQLTFKVWNIYEQPLDYVQIKVHHNSGYRYTQILNSEHTNEGGITITLPAVLEDIHVSVTRGGFHPIAEDIILKEGVQQVDVFMEPRLSR